MEGGKEGKDESTDGLRDSNPIESKKKVFTDKASAFDAISQEFKEEVDRVEQEFKKLPDSANKSIEEFHTKAKETGDRISDKTQSIYGYFSGKIDSLFKDIRNTIIILSIVFAASYIGLNYSNIFDQDGNFQVELEVLVWPIVIIVSLILLYYYSNKLRNRLGDEKSVLDSYTASIKETASQIKGKIPVNTPSLSPAENIRERLGRTGKEMVNNGLSFVPFAEEFLEKKSRNYEQKLFANNIYRALRYYGYDDRDDKLFKWSIGFVTPCKSDAEWMDEAVNEIVPITTLNRLVLKLIYYDYTGKEKPELTNTWSLLKKDKNLVKQIIKLVLAQEGRAKDASLQNDEAYDTLVQLASTMEPFRFDGFTKMYYDFYVELVKKKDIMRNAIYRLGFNPDVYQKDIEKFMPSRYEEEKWEDELVKFTSELVGVNCTALSILYYDTAGLSQQKNREWNIALANERIFASLFSMLISNGRIRVPDAYKSNKGLEPIRKVVQVS